jgi:hypothetical protein
MSERFWPLAGVGGLVFVALFVVGSILAWDVATYDEGGEAVAAWFADNGSRYIVSEVVILIGFLLYPLFLVGLFVKLSRAEGPVPLFSGAALIGGILFGAVGAAFSLFHGSLALLEGEVSAEVAALASAATLYGYAFGAAAIAIAAGAAAVVILTTRVFWSWLGWLGVVVAVLAVIGMLSPLQNDPEGVLSILGLIGFIGFGVWIVAASVALLQTPSPTATTATAV